MTSIHSDWDEWLPQAVERADPDELTVWYLGFNGFVCKSAGGTTVFVDPYLGTGDPPRTIRMVPVPFDPADVGSVDAVFATHEHTDHVHAPSQAPLLTAGADWYGPETSHELVEEWATDWAIDGDRLETVTPGDTFRVGDIDVTVIEGHDPDAVEPVGYVFEAGSRTFAHVGDSRPGEVFEAVGETHDIDVGAVAVGSAGLIPDKDTRRPTETMWYNDENQAIALARALGADRLVPTHWDAWKSLTANPAALHDHARSFEHPRRVEVVEIGDRLEV